MLWAGHWSTNCKNRRKMEIQWWFFKISKYVPAISSSTDENFYLAFNLYFQQQLWVWTSLSQFRPVQNCFRPDQAFVKFFEMLCQGRHGWQSPLGPGLSWILQNRKRQRQWQHAADVSITVPASPAKNWPWRPWLLWYSTNLETYRVKTRSMRTTTNCYLVSLAVADTITLIVSVPQEVISYHILGDRWVWGSVGCTLMIYLQVRKKQCDLSCLILYYLILH